MGRSARTDQSAWNGPRQAWLWARLNLCARRQRVDGTEAFWPYGAACAGAPRRGIRCDHPRRTRTLRGTVFWVPRFRCHRRITPRSSVLVCECACPVRADRPRRAARATWDAEIRRPHRCRGRPGDPAIHPGEIPRELRCPLRTDLRRARRREGEARLHTDRRRRRSRWSAHPQTASRHWGGYSV